MLSFTALINVIKQHFPWMRNSPFLDGKHFRRLNTIFITVRTFSNMFNEDTPQRLLPPRFYHYHLRLCHCLGPLSSQHSHRIQVFNGFIWSFNTFRMFVQTAWESHKRQHKSSSNNAISHPQHPCVIRLSYWWWWGQSASQPTVSIIRIPNKYMNSSVRLESFSCSANKALRVTQIISLYSTGRAYALCGKWNFMSLLFSQWNVLVLFPLSLSLWAYLRCVTVPHRKCSIRVEHRWNVPLGPLSPSVFESTYFPLCKLRVKTVNIWYPEAKLAFLIPKRNARPFRHVEWKEWQGAFLMVDRKLFA